VLSVSTLTIVVPFYFRFFESSLALNNDGKLGGKSDWRTKEYEIKSLQEIPPKENCRLGKLFFSISDSSHALGGNIYLLFFYFPNLLLTFQKKQANIFLL